MLILPDVGFEISTLKHNCNLSIACDWIEGSLFFSNERFVSKSDIIDILIHENIYSEQDFAAEFTDNCWVEISRRQRYFEKNKFLLIEKNKISKLYGWEEIPAYSFCLLTSLRNYYNIKVTGDFFNKQGLLLEEISENSLKTLFPTWYVLRTGYNVSTKSNFISLLEKIAEKLNIVVSPMASNYYKPRAKDGKLDLILYKNLNDLEPNIPVYLIQCASGENWRKKLNEPNIEQWQKFLIFDSHLSKGTIIPYCLLSEEHKVIHPQVNGVFIDRMRLLSAYNIQKEWHCEELSKNIINHNTKIVSKLKFFD